MSDRPPRVGARLREARLRHGLSLSALAERTGVTKSFLSQLERDLTSPSVASLVRLCDALDVGVGELLDGPAGPVVRHAERPAVHFGGQGVSEFRLTPAGEQRLLVLLSDIAPLGGSGDEPYALQTDVEHVLVLQGRLEVEVAGTTHRLAAGDALTFEAGADHRWRNPSPVQPAQVVWTLVPGLP